MPSLMLVGVFLVLMYNYRLFQHSAPARLLSSFWETFSTGYNPIMEAFHLANTTLAIDIYRNLNEKCKKESFIISPFTISSSLALAYKGAKEETAKQLEKILHYEKVKDYDFGFQTQTSDISRISAASSLKIVKRLLVDSSFKCTKEFKNSVKKAYPSELEEIDMKTRPEEARNQINTSIKDLTDGNVDNVLTEGMINENTNMLLLGAAYFKGNWLYKFNQSETKEEDFYVTKTETKPVQMMQLDARLGIRTLNEQNLMILDIPFTGKQMSMLIIMPKCIEDDSNGLEKLEKDLTCENYMDWTNPSMMANSKVKLSLPKLKIENILNLKDGLQSLGMKDAFNEEVADFSGMSETTGLFISEALYEASIDIGEDGTEAADVIRERVLMPKTECNVNHPFLLTIKHNKTQGMLFFGRYTGPSVSS